MVAQIIDTPELWAPVGSSNKGKDAAGNRTITGVDLQATRMPGTINLNESGEDDAYTGGCSC